MESGRNAMQINYLLGIGRSGSTLLTTLLNAHSQIKAIPEVPIATFFVQQYGNLHTENKDLEALSQDYLETIQKIRPKHLVDLHAEKLQTSEWHYSSYLDFLKSVYANFDILEKNGASPMVIDKNPYYTFHYDVLCALNPTAKFIILVRDYRANVLSRKKKTLNKSGNVVFNAFLCREFFREINRIRHNENCLLVHYETLVNEPKNTLTNICNFLGLEFEEHLLTAQVNHEIDANVESKKSKQFIKSHFSDLKKPIHGGNTDKWKTELSAEEIAICDAICAKEAAGLGYFPVSEKQRSFHALRFFNYTKFLRAKFNVKKERLLYYFPLQLKLKRLKQTI
jgi:hypothetical protein